MTVIPPIISAGFVVRDNEAIWGVGSTAADAWADFLNGMSFSGVTLLSDDDDSGEQHGSWGRETDFVIVSASSALLADVKARGGNIGWSMIGGVACTRDEAEGE